MYPVSISIHARNEVTADTEEGAKRERDKELRYSCRKVHFTHDSENPGNPEGEAELFADTMLTLIFMEADSSRIPDDCPFPIPIVDKIAYAMGVPRSVLLRNGKPYEGTYAYAPFTRSMRMDTIATQFFINTEAITEFIGKMRALPPKKRKTGVVFLLQEREKMYGGEEDRVVCPYGKTAIATLFLIKTWMAVLLSNHLDKAWGTRTAFSALAYDDMLLPSPASADNMLLSSLADAYTRDHSLDDVTVEFILRHYFSPLEGNPLKAVVDGNQELSEHMAICHLVSTLCSDLVCWPPYTSSRALVHNSVYDEQNVWSFTCHTEMERTLGRITDRGRRIYGPGFPMLLRDDMKPKEARYLFLGGCSYAQSVVLLDAVQHVLRNVVQGDIVQFCSFRSPTIVKMEKNTSGCYDAQHLGGNHTRYGDTYSHMFVLLIYFSLRKYVNAQTQNQARVKTLEKGRWNSMRRTFRVWWATLSAGPLAWRPR